MQPWCFVKLYYQANQSRHQKIRQLILCYMGQQSNLFPEVIGSCDAENNDRTIQEKATDDSETYLTTPGSE